ncbi:MAG: monovalent cation/H(+) antiporter subunit G [Spirochaetaceae bacterium]|nr:MAG: monovalent cation/H(+) antiporter subunit G [Spirochaetaceae bacterium]
MIDPEFGRSIVASALLLTGAAFFLITAFGMFRFRLMYDRLHVATKCLTGGVLSILVGYMFIAPTPYALAKALLGSLFLLMTNAVASHALARAAYRQQCDTTGLSVDHLAEDLNRVQEVE